MPYQCFALVKPAPGAASVALDHHGQRQRGKDSGLVCSAGIGPGERLQTLAWRGLQAIRERFRLCPLHLGDTLQGQAARRLRSMATTYKGEPAEFGKKRTLSPRMIDLL